MKKYLGILKNTRVFKGIGEEEISAMFTCLDAQLKHYKKGEYILRQGDTIEVITVLVRGRAHIQTEDYWGNRSIVNTILEGEMFGEAYAASEKSAITHDVVAVEDSSVIFFNIKKMLTVCSSACRFHATVIQNLFFAVSEKNRTLLHKLSHMSKRTTREKLISYLSEQAKKKNSPHFFIPFNRQQLADFLSVDRSAMSNELCKLRDEGLIEFKKNEFTLL